MTESWSHEPFIVIYSKFKEQLQSQLFYVVQNKNNESYYKSKKAKQKVHKKENDTKLADWIINFHEEFRI